LTVSPRNRLRKVVILNTADEGGGAEIMSMAVLEGFAERGIDTWLLVGNKKGNDERVLSFFEGPHVDYRRFLNAHHIVARRIESRLGLESFSHAYSRQVMHLTGGSPPDLVLCHNLHGGYFDLRALPPLSRRVPVALRLFDSWLLTGHCASALGCERWRTGCGHCPDLAIPPAIKRDATAFNWRRKQRILAGGRYFVSAESEWMLGRARSSLLAPAVAGWKLIPGGVDLAVFSPGPQQAARQALGLAPDQHVILSVMNLGTDNRLKDFATIRQALLALRRREPHRRVVVLVAGADGADEQIAPDIALRRIGYLRSRARLADFYRAADMLVHSAVEEPFGLAVAEALACGTPVVTASAGGVREIVGHGRSGLAVPLRDSIALAEAIGALLDDPSRRAHMGEAAADFARQHLDRRAMIGALHAWCEDVHARWHADAGAPAHSDQ
jgi:glycosyltransferase involved in cell wall biosynthesis